MKSGNCHVRSLSLLLILPALTSCSETCDEASTTGTGAAAPTNTTGTGPADTTSTGAGGTGMSTTGGSGGSGAGGSGAGGSGAGGSGAGGSGAGGAGGTGGSGGAPEWCTNGLAIMNPSFETPVLVADTEAAAPGWVVQGGTVVMLFPTTGLAATAPLAAPGDGNQVLRVGANLITAAYLNLGIMSQPNTTYRLKFAAGRRTGSSGPGSLKVRLVIAGPSGEGTEVLIGNAMVPEGGWATHELVYVSNYTQPLFIGLGNTGFVTPDNDFLVDNFCLTTE